MSDTSLTDAGLLTEPLPALEPVHFPPLTTAPSEAPPLPPLPPSSGWHRPNPLRIGVVVSVIGLVITAVLGVLAAAVNQRNERHLLKLQVQEAGSLLGAVTPILQTPLTSALELALSSGASSGRFAAFMQPEVSGKSKTFVDASLWTTSGGQSLELAHVGPAPQLTPLSSAGRALFRAASKSPALQVSGLLGSSPHRIGLAVGAPYANGTYVVYAELALSPSRAGKVEQSSAFSDLVYAIYLGRSPRPAALVKTVSPTLPLTGETASVVAPFGSSSLLMVAAATSPLTGWLPTNLVWIIALLGLLVSGGAGWTGFRLARARLVAEDIAAENERLYAEERDVATTLQHALLPTQLPRPAGMEVAVRYLPGVGGVEIGGDWYDLIDVGDDDLLLVVGDVSGRGLRAATVMASLRYAIRAYAALSEGPGALLARLNGLVDLSRDRHFATVLCARIGPGTRTITLANAGHPQPLLLTGQSVGFVEVPVGPPIGVSAQARYAEATVQVPTTATLLAYTDGLTERPGETLDAGLQRLARATEARAGLNLPVLIDAIVQDLATTRRTDDIAVLGLQWLN